VGARPPRSVPSLAGRRVAVTRGSTGDDALTARLVALGAEVLEAPAISTGPPESWGELDDALRAVESFAWIAFASANAVERTVTRAVALELGPPALARPRLAAVGAATARCLERLVRAPDLVPPVATGAALAAAMAAHVAGCRVLVPRPAEGRPELVEGLLGAGAEVVAPVAYRTVPASTESLEPLASALAAWTVDAVLFASPSAVRSVVAALGARSALLGTTVLAAIGPTTAAELRALGFEVGAQPGVSSGAALADAVAARLGLRAP